MTCECVSIKLLGLLAIEVAASELADVDKAKLVKRIVEIQEAINAETQERIEHQESIVARLDDLEQLTGKLSGQ